MNRPLHIWITFLACLGLLLAVMGWVSWNTLALESAREKAAQNADVQESVRLALWRLDFQASALLIRENARPPHDFRAFYAQEGLVDKDNGLFKKGDVMAASPLLAEPPEHVLLHFQMDATGALRSPQVPQNGEREVALTLFVNEDTVTRSEQRLQTLRELLAKPAATATNREILTQTACVSPQEFRQEVVSKLLEMPTDGNLRNNNWSAQQGIAQSSQGFLNSLESVVRSRAVAQQSEEAMKQQVTIKTKEPEAKTAVKAESKPSLEAKKAMPKVLDAPTSALAQRQEAAAAVRTPESKPFQGVWLDGNLILTREAWVDGVRLIQGVWLDWPAMRSAWLKEITDLFSGARLDPAANVSPGARPTDDPLRFAALPVRLVMGVIPLAEMPFWTPLRKSLVIALGCGTLAAFAVALLLYGTVALSERRASFVSAVTHELRTPLTTFRLYSEMLADGMVKDEAQRKTYLDTLSGEAGRLSHLVENVLAYARLERGSAQERAENLTIGELLDRITPRLRQRADECEMELRIEAGESERKTRLRIDAAAVEQILFNLVDNACKYATPRAVERVIHLEADTSGRFAMLRVRDHGGGISRGERRRIFHPFHKSADQAAHSAPGVGLGLALCRRLASALGGAITLDTACKDGACFVVKLPRP